jgi:poly-gamma-glutamate capsule biosynthesis protein CapA/YwtB (metallophosphatase superfamily)
MKKLLYMFLIVLLTFFMTSCEKSEKTNEVISWEAKIPEVTQNTKETEIRKQVSIISVGDIMFHMPQIKSAYNGKGYDFKPVFEPVKSYIESSDIAIGNLETTINPSKKLSSYPRFNSPVEILEGIRYAGFDILTTANNHCTDTGNQGIISTVKLIKKHGMLPSGTGSKNDKKYAVLDKNGIKVGVLAYTSSTNFVTAPQDMVNYAKIENIRRDINEVRPLCDFLIVYVHTGTEYVRSIEESQRKLFRDIADLGADCVLGSHPHVVRPSEIYESKGRKIFISYSMGNFISNQNDKYTDIGEMIKLNVYKDISSTKLEGVEIIPVYRLRYSENGKRKFKVVPCSEIDSYGISKGEKDYVKAVYNSMIKHEMDEVFKYN